MQNPCSWPEKGSNKTSQTGKVYAAIENIKKCKAIDVYTVFILS